MNEMLPIVAPIIIGVEEKLSEDVELSELAVIEEASVVVVEVEVDVGDDAILLVISSVVEEAVVEDVDVTRATELLEGTELSLFLVVVAVVVNVDDEVLVVLSSVIVEEAVVEDVDVTRSRELLEDTELSAAAAEDDVVVNVEVDDEDV